MTLWLSASTTNTRQKQSLFPPKFEDKQDRGFLTPARIALFGNVSGIKSKGKPK